MDKVERQNIRDKLRAIRMQKMVESQVPRYNKMSGFTFTKERCWDECKCGLPYLKAKGKTCCLSCTGLDKPVKSAKPDRKLEDYLR